MTDEKALKDMRERCRICKENTFPTEDDCEDCYFPPAIEALERRIPKRAIHIGEAHFAYWNIAVNGCPICGEEIRFVDHSKIKHCSHCGQALKCEGEEDDK